MIVARPLYIRAPRPVHALALAFVAATALQARVLSEPPHLPISIIPLGRLSHALVLDPRSGHAFVANEGDGTVSVVDLARAQVLRTVAAGDPTMLAPLALTIDPRTQHVFVASRGDAGTPSVVHMLDSTTGTRLATVSAGQEPSAVAVDTRQGHVFVANAGDGTVSMLDARRGTVLRTVTVGDAPVALAVDERTARVAVVSIGGQWDSASVASVGSVSLLDSGSGRRLWTAYIGDGSDAIALDERAGRLFVANRNGGTVSVLDLHSGAVLRTLPVGSLPAALAVDERRQRLFVACAGDDTLRVLDARSGAVLATRHLDPAANAAYPRPYALAVDEARDRVYLSTWGGLEQVAGMLTLRGAGQLYVLDARTGAPRQTLAVGVAPAAVAVEAGRGRVVVVSGGGAMRAPQGWVERGWQQVAAWAPWLGRLAPPGPDVIREPGRVEVIDPGP